jgi:uncharacterized protein YfaQ (DUF2300 family)
MVARAAASYATDRVHTRPARERSVLSIRGLPFTARKVRLLPPALSVYLPRSRASLSLDPMPHSR